MSQPLVSFLISTHNRISPLRQTLEALTERGAAGRHPWEIIVVDNASSDGTAEMVRREFPRVSLLRQFVNLGPCTKNLGLAEASGEYVVFLDDDSYPFPFCVERMIEHFDADPFLGAAIFAVQLPSGEFECSAYPEVFAGCGVGLRMSALRQVGGLPDDFFMQAEEYDLSLRLLDGGWRVRRFEDLCVRHMKTQAARFPGRVMRLDVRNNLTLIGRYFPDEWVLPFAADWAKRYFLIARAHGRLQDYSRGLAEGSSRLLCPRERRPVSDAAFETFVKVRQIQDRLARAAAELNLKRVLLVDLGKNVLPYWRASQNCGVEVVGVADALLGKLGATYRGVPIVTDDAAGTLNFDAAIVSNLSPVHAERRLMQWRQRTPRPVIDLFEVPRIAREPLRQCA